MKAWILLLIFACTNSLSGQNYFQHDYALSKKEDNHFKLVWENKKESFEAISMVEQKVLQQVLTEEQRFLLQDLFNQIKNAKDLYLDRFLTAYPDPYQKLVQNKANLDSLYLIEKQSLAINEQLAHYRAMYLSEATLAHYPVDLSESRKKELKFYNFKSGEKILEVGAGDEDFIASLASVYRDLIVFVNEIDQLKLKRLYYQISFNPIFRTNGHQFYVIEGTAKETGAIDQKFDKIIIRNAIHHFTYPHAMMEAIVQSLKAGGEIFIMERYEESCTEGCCADLWTSVQLKSFLRKKGLFLKEELLVPLENGWKYWILKIRFE